MNRLPWLALGIGLVAILYGMLGFWIRGYDNYDRALIFAATGWLLSYHQYFKNLPDTPKPAIGLVLVLVGAAAILPPWYVFTQIGPRPIILWWESLALVTAVIGVILIRSGPNLLYHARFLLIFPLFALPLPGRIQNPLHEVMQAISAEIGSWIIPLFGVPILERDANRIMLPSGGIHVAEVCSGLYMIRTTLALTAFLSHYCKFTLPRGLILMACSIPIIILVNSLRVAAFGLLQEWGLHDWVRPGTKHEIVGYIAYIPGLFIVLSLVRWLAPPKSETVEPAGVAPQPSSLATNASSVILVLAVAAGVAILQLPGVTESTAAEPDFSKFPLTVGNWKRFEINNPEEPQNKDFPEDEEVKTKLTYNNALHRRYSTDGGRMEVIDLWLIYWKSSMVVKDYHHPDICYVGSGDTLEKASNDEIRTPGGRTLTVTYREFKSSRGRKYVVYWTQEGRRVWTTADERKAASFLFPFYWIQERIDGRRQAGQTDDRLVIHLGMPEYPTANKVTLLKFAALVADETYTLCPWADPK